MRRDKSSMVLLNLAKVVRLLTLIERHPTMRLRDLAEALGVSVVTLTRWLAALEADAGVVVRYRRSEALYEVQSWGVFDKEAVLSARARIRPAATEHRKAVKDR